MLKKILTIGIPTYNNVIGVRHQLEYYLTQTQNTQLSKELEILISDNSNNNETKELVDTFISKIPELIYIKNVSNIGFDRNVDQVLNMSNGQFCWTLSDDDFLVDGALEQVLSIVKKHEDVSCFIISKNKKNAEVTVLESMKAVITSNNNGLTGGLVSENIFNKKFLPIGRNQYYGNQWFHISLLLEIGANKKVALIPNVFKEKQHSECRWASNGNVFITYTSLHAIVMNLVHFGYSDTFLKTYHNTFIKNLPHQMVTAKLYGLQCTKKNVQILVKSAKKEPFILLFCLCIMVTPAIVFVVLKKIWRKL